MNALDAALLQAWDTHVVPRLATPAGRAELAHRLQSRHVNRRGVLAARPLRSFTLVLRANDRRLHDNNTAGAVPLDPDEIQRLCAPIHLPPPGVSRADAARLLGVAPSALAARVKQGHLLKHRPHARVSTRTGKYPGDPPRANVFYHAPLPHHLVHPVPDVRSADWGQLNQHLHRRPAQLRTTPSPPSRGVPAARSTPQTWSQTLHRTVRQLRPDQPKAQYERFEWQCPDCGGLSQRLYWPFRPMTLPAYLNFDFHQLAPELPPEAISHLKSEIENQNLPFTAGFTCRPCLQRRFGGPGLTYESTEFTAHHGQRPRNPQAAASSPRAPLPKNTWHRFIQRLTMGMLRGREVVYFK